MEKNYHIVIGSPLDYEELVAYININGQYVALLNQDEGKDKIKVEFFNEPTTKPLYLNVFYEALQEAHKELLK